MFALVFVICHHSRQNVLWLPDRDSGRPFVFSVFTRRSYWGMITIVYFDQFKSVHKTFFTFFVSSRKFNSCYSSVLAWIILPICLTIVIVFVRLMSCRMFVRWFGASRRLFFTFGFKSICFIGWIYSKLAKMIKHGSDFFIKTLTSRHQGKPKSRLRRAWGGVSIQPHRAVGAVVAHILIY